MQPQVVAVPRPRHQAVLAELHRLLVGVGRLVADVEDGHGGAEKAKAGGGAGLQVIRQGCSRFRKPGE